MISESWIQLEALLEDYMGSEVDREMANAIKALAKGYSHDCLAVADPLAMLEALAKRYITASSGLFAHEIVRVQYWATGTFMYLNSVSAQLTRAEAEALLEAKE